MYINRVEILPINQFSSNRQRVNTIINIILKYGRYSNDEGDDRAGEPDGSAEDRFRGGEAERNSICRRQIV